MLHISNGDAVGVEVSKGGKPIQGEAASLNKAKAMACAAANLLKEWKF